MCCLEGNAGKCAGRKGGADSMSENSKIKFQKYDTELSREVFTLGMRSRFYVVGKQKKSEAGETAREIERQCARARNGKKTSKKDADKVTCVYIHVEGRRHDQDVCAAWRKAEGSKVRRVQGGRQMCQKLP